MSPIIEVLKETLKRAIGKRDYKTTEKIIIKTHKGDIAEVFKYLNKEERKIFMLTLIKSNIQKAADVFQDLEEDIKFELLRNLSSKDLTNLLNNLPVNEIVKIIDHIPDDVRDIILKNLEKEKIEELEDLEQLLTTNEDNIASIIREDFLNINENITVYEALEIVKNTDKEIEILYIYVGDDKNRLIGVVSLKDLITSPSNILVKDMMIRELITVNINATKEETIDIFKRYDLYILPVINDEEELVGVVYIQDIIDVISEKTTEDFFKMAGAKEEELFYQDKTFKIAKLRMPWLLTAIFGEFITAIIISFFSFTIEQFLPIIFFLPMVAALSGNISSQSAIITARGLKEGRLSENIVDYIRSIIKELKVALVIGFGVGLLVGLISSLWINNHKLGMIVGVALFFSIVIAGLIGSLIPYIMDKMGKDPTLATGVLALTITDIVGISIYLSVATYFIHYLHL